MDTVTTIDLLRRYESPNVTYIDPDGSWPIVWERARGVHVWDEKGKRYLDFTAAFGVAAAGHANPRVVKAGQKQMGRLLHAMGDVHPHPLKGELARELSRLTFERWQAGEGKTIFGNSGFEAVEAAFKTAILLTGKPGLVVFEGAYHGLGYGALNATHRDQFKSPFRQQLKDFGFFLPFPTRSAELPEVEQRLAEILREKPVGAILVEPVQARGGNHIPPADFLPLLRKLADEHGILLILDEIYTGFGRTGKWFACEHFQVVPDLICLGKALTGGFPLSACVGRADLMDRAWPPSTGEAIHTSTYLGHPVGCAMALAQIQELEKENLVEKSAVRGEYLLGRLRELALRAEKLELKPRGIGLMIGLEILHLDGQPATKLALDLIKKLLSRGFIFLPEGEAANVISFTPPLMMNERDLQLGFEAVAQELEPYL